MLDVWLPGVDGLVTLQRLRERKVDSQVVIISGHGNIESAVRAIKMGAFDFVEKPLSLEKTVLVVRNALRQRDSKTRIVPSAPASIASTTMVGESPAMRHLREQVAIAAPTNGRVLIFGENGTGKELVARTDASASRRRNGPFVEVNCAAIPEELIESELFGHMRGAFTGAVADKPGRFEQRQRRHDLSRRDRRHEPEDAGQGAARAPGAGDGARRRHAADQRGRARACGDQQGAAGRNQGRPLPRRSVFPSERHPDFRAAAARPAGRHPAARRPLHGDDGSEYGRRPKRLAPEAAARLQHYAGRATCANCATSSSALMIMVPGDTITAQDLASSDATEPAERRRRRSRRAAGRGARQFERDYILQALARAAGNISRTADALGVERSNLYKKMRAFGIAPSREKTRRSERPAATKSELSRAQSRSLSAFRSLFSST